MGRTSLAIDIGIGGGGSLPLSDQIGSPVGLYGFRKLRAAYSGNAVRVRRSSDDAEADIGFASDGSFDSAAFSSHVGVGTGYCVTWYDQSGNGYDLAQGTNASQPIIQQGENNYWCLYATGGTFVQESSFVGATTNMTCSLLWEAHTDGNESSAQGGIDFEASTGGFISPWWTTNHGPLLYLDGSTYDSRRVWDDRKPRLHTYKFLNGTISAFEGASPMAEPGALANPAYTRLTVGKNDFGNANARFYELTLFSTNADIDTIWTNIKTDFANLWSYTDNVLVLGDSLTQTLYTGPGDNWSRLAFANTDTAFTDWNVLAQGGYRLQDWIDDQSEWQWYTDNLTFSDQKIALIFCGTNDIFTDTLTGAQTYTKLKTLTTALSTVGYTKIIPFTQLPRGASSIDAERAAFNAAIKTDGDFIDVVCLDSEANLLDATNTTYFNADQVHLKDPGAALIHPLVTAALDGQAASVNSGAGNGIEVTYDASNHNMTNNVSWRVRFKTSNANTTGGSLFAHGGGANRKWYTYFVNSKIAMIVSADGNTTNAKYYTYNTTLADGNWHEFVATFSSGTLTLYIDGAVISNDDITKDIDGTCNALHTTTNDITLGSYWDGTTSPSLPFLGSCNEWTLFNKVLSASEVASLWNSGARVNPYSVVSSANIKGYWKVNGNGTYTDLANGNNGTAVGTVTDVLGIPIY